MTLNQAAKNYGPSNFDVRNNFKGYVVYQLPFGRGKMFLNQNALADAVVGGWEISSTVVESAGNPFQLTSNGNTYTQAGVQFPNRVPGVSMKPQGGQSWKQWFNPCAFSFPGNGNFGTLGRNPMVGPGINYFNMSGGKTFSLSWKGVKIAIRADAQNVLRTYP